MGGDQRRLHGGVPYGYAANTCKVRDYRASQCTQCPALAVGAVDHDALGLRRAVARVDRREVGAAQPAGRAAEVQDREADVVLAGPERPARSDAAAVDDRHRADQVDALVVRVAGEDRQRRARGVGLLDPLRQIARERRLVHQQHLGPPRQRVPPAPVAVGRRREAPLAVGQVGERQRRADAARVAAPAVGERILEARDLQPGDAAHRRPGDVAVPPTRPACVSTIAPRRAKLRISASESWLPEVMTTGSPALSMPRSSSDSSRAPLTEKSPGMNSGTPCA